jgi:SAM-dependent methyltransferase
MNDLRKRWDARWREKAQNAESQADPWLKRVFPLLDRGRVLDVACGSGRNTLYLAEQHFDVTAVDLSPQALELLAQEAVDRALVVKSLLVDLESTPLLPEGPFDLIIDFFYLHRPLIPKLADRLRPGGCWYFEPSAVRVSFLKATSTLVSF